jgi:hypothetical protein
MKRPYIPLPIRLEAALLQLGLDQKTAELDHDPALELRERVYVWRYDRTMLSDHGGQYYTVPDANDPKYLVWRSKADHARKTNGPGGEKRITTRGGDHGDAAHLRAVTAKEAAFRQRVLAKDELPPAIRPTTFRKRKITSRPFPKRKPGRRPK